MNRKKDLQPEDFEALLKVLSADREDAGRQYEQVRLGLVRYFRYRGCPDPLVLADETINRVARKISAFDPSKNPNPMAYFYGFAANIYREFLTGLKKAEIPMDDFKDSFKETEENDFSEHLFNCYKKCLDRLSSEERSLIINYFGKEKDERHRERQRIADQLQIQMNTLHTRIFRIRTGLKGCLKNCKEKLL